LREADVEYENWCSAVPCHKQFDAFSGKIIDGEEPLCSEVNIDGHCPYFKKKLAFK
jgi:hypothetical protein